MILTAAALFHTLVQLCLQVVCHCLLPTPWQEGVVCAAKLQQQQQQQSTTVTSQDAVCTS
jgi:hypothetical protein